MALNRASEVLAADWLSQTHLKNYRNFLTCGGTVFLSVGNPYGALQFIS